MVVEALEPAGLCGSDAFQPKAHKQIVQRLARRFVWCFRQGAGGLGALEFGAETLVFRFVEGRVGVSQRRILALGLPLDQFGEVGQAEVLVERDEVRLNHAGPHQVDAREQHAIDIEQRLHPPRWWLLARAFEEELPLRLGEPEVVVGMVPGDEAGAAVSIPPDHAYMQLSLAFDSAQPDDPSKEIA